MGGKGDGFWFKGIGKGFLFLAVGLAFCFGCTREKEQPPKGKHKIVMAIRKPATVTPARKIEPPKSVLSEKVPTQHKPPGKTAPEPAPPPREAPEAMSSKAVASVTQPAKGPPVGPTPVRPEAAGREELPEPTQVPSKEPAPVPSVEKKMSPKLERGFIRVGKGQSLSAVAARADVYGDFLKWPELYRLNLDHLAMIRAWDDVEKRTLPVGLVLKYEDVGNEGRHRIDRERKAWVVNVLSLKTPGKLAGPAIHLIRAGYDAYITRAVVKNEPWLRLRVGFFRDRSGALKARKQIREFLGKDDSWIARAGKKEVEEFAEH